MEQSYQDLIGRALDAVESEYARQLLLRIEENTKQDAGIWKFFVNSNPLEAIFTPQWVKAASCFMILFLLLSLCEGFVKGKTGSAIRYVLQLLMTTVITVSVHELLSNATAHMRDFSAFFGILAPTLGILTASGGNVSSAAANGLVLSVFLTAMQILLQTIVPFVCTLFCGLSVLDAFSGGGKLLPLTTAIRNFLFGAFSLLTTIFFILIGCQNITAANMDTVSAKTLRVLVTNTIPIIGGAVGDALRIVGGSLIGVKNAVGTAAMLFIIGMYIPVFFLLFGNGTLMTFFSFLSNYFSIPDAKPIFMHLKCALDFSLAAYTSVFVIAVLNIGVFLQGAPAVIAS